MCVCVFVNTYVCKHITIHVCLLVSQAIHILHEHIGHTIKGKGDFHPSFPFMHTQNTYGL